VTPGRGLRATQGGEARDTVGPTMPNPPPGAREILVVDDDPRLREVLVYALTRAGFHVREAGDGRQALTACTQKMPDLLVLDVLMPELDGLDVCRELRRTSPVPILFLSSKGEELDRVLGLEMGGDDYVTKPFSPRELVSRVKAVLRRTRPAAPEPDVLSAGAIRLDPEAHRCFVDNAEVSLTLTEFRLLETLLSRPGRAFTRDELVDRAYEGRHFVSGRTVDSHIRRVRQKLRTKLQDAGVAGDPIETVHGLGYRLARP
jgi:two-component system, OmpR family, response regulator